MSAVPERPALPDDQTATWQGHMRYEDVAQDGRMIPLALPPHLGGMWRSLMSKHPGNRSASRAGIVPILTRLVLTTTEHHVRLDKPVEGRGAYQLAHGVDATGAVDRIYMLMWADVLGARGRLVPPEPAGELALAGAMFAEHTFTRPFGPPDQRRVTRLPTEGFPEVPDARYDATPIAVVADLADALDELTIDPAETAFTLDQTDSNQHVNSLVYIRVFIDAAQRRFAKLGLPLRVRSRSVEIAYRKPSFAGDRVRVHLRASPTGAAGYIAGDDGKPRCYVRVLFSS